MKSLLGLFTIFVFCLLGTACAKHEFAEISSKPLIPNENPEVLGPSILLIQVPNSVLGVGDEVTVEYQIIPGSAPITSVVCLLDGKPLACSADRDRLVLTSTVEGLHGLEIQVVDANELKDVEKIPWEVYDKFQKMKTPVTIVDEDDQVDVLFVIDNSLSMKDEQANMAERIGSFMDRVRGFDWRVAIVTTDPRTDKDFGDGRFLKFQDGSYFLTSKLDLAKAKTLFAQTIQRSEAGDAAEQGIRATYRAVERALKPKIAVDYQHKKFFREKAALAVVVISDENETGTQLINKGTELAKFLVKTWSTEKIFKFHSIIVRPGDNVCLNASKAHATGTTYAALTTLTGGVLGNICEKDYGNQLTLIGQSVVNTQNTFELSCNPKDINNDGVADVFVTSTSGKPVPNFIVQGNKIVFSLPPSAGNYSIEYYCPKK